MKTRVASLGCLAWRGVMVLGTLVGTGACQRAELAEAQVAAVSSTEKALNAACAGRVEGEYCGGCMRCSATLDCNVPAGVCFPAAGTEWTSTPTGSTTYLRAVWAASPADAWAVGVGTPPVLHWDGRTWEPFSVGPASPNLYGVWGSSSTDVWAVGDTVLHWDGVTWTEFPGVNTSYLESVSGTSSTDVVAVGDFGVIHRWNGTTWATIQTGGLGFLHSVWTSGPNNLWVVSLGGQTYRWNGTGWSLVSNPFGSSINGIWGTGANDVWAVGIRGAAAHWNGQAWSALATGIPSDLKAVWSSAANDVYAVGGNRRALAHWDGSAWAEVTIPAGDYLWGVSGSSSRDVWAVGGYGAMHQAPVPCTSNAQCAASPNLPLCSSGATCLPVDGLCLATPAADDVRCGTLDCSGLDTDCRTYPDITANRCAAAGQCKAPNVLSTCATFVPSAGGTACRPGGTGATVPPCAQCDAVGGCTVTPQDDAACGSISCAGTGSVCRDYAPITTNRCVGLGQCKVASPATCTVSTPTPGAYCGGCKTCDANLECNQDLGTCFSAVDPAWSTETSPVTELLLATWGASFNDVWAVGAAGTMLHHNGVRWTAVPSGTGVTLRALWGSSSKDVWAAGDGGTLLHWTGTGSWVAVPGGTTDPINGLWGTSALDVWAVGGTASSSTVLRWNGTAWNTVASNTVDFLSGVWGSSANDVWAVGRSGTSIHWDGTRWSVMPTGSTQNLSGVWGSSPTDVWAVGLQGVIRHWDGTAWAGVASGTNSYFYAVWGSAEDDVWAVGSSSPGTALHWDGARWTGVPLGNPNFLLGLWGSSSADVFAVGGAGTTLRLSAPACTGNTQCAASPRLPMCLDGATCLGRDGLCLAGAPMADDARCGTLDCNGLDSACVDYQGVVSGRCTVGTASSHARCKPPNTLATCTAVVMAANGTPCDDQNPCTTGSVCQDQACGGGTVTPQCSAPDAGPGVSSSSSHGPSSSVSQAGPSSSTSHGVSSSGVVAVSSSAAVPSSAGASASAESGSSLASSSVATSTAASVATSAAGSAAPPDNGGGGGGGKSGPCACAGLPAAHPIMAWLGMFALAVWRRRRG